MKRLFGIVLCGAAFLMSVATPVAQAQSSALVVQVSKTSVEAGERFNASVFVRTPTQAINAVSGTLRFPESHLRIVGISKAQSVIDLWTKEPTALRGALTFEGIVLNPGFQGNHGTVFSVSFEAKSTGPVSLLFSDGAVLANDGYGSNIASSLESANLRIIATTTPEEVSTVAVSVSPPTKRQALPVITDFSEMVDPDGAAYIRGRGEPHALTKIVFHNTSFKSIGEQFIAFLQTKKQSLDEAIVQNEADGSFEYFSPSGIVAGAYNATPYLVDAQTDSETAGLGVRLFVSDSPVVKLLVVIINVLALLIPVVGLGVVIYFIPWYSFRRMRLLGRRFGLEEDKITFSRKVVQQQPTPETQNTQG